MVLKKLLHLVSLAAIAACGEGALSTTQSSNDTGVSEGSGDGAAGRNPLTRYDNLDDFPEEFALGQCAFNFSPITYAFSSYTSDISQNSVKASLRNAFSLWANQTSLRFNETNNVNNADIVLLWGSLQHNRFDGRACPNPFDGQDWVLAHAWPPCFASPITEGHFDDDETWTDAIVNSNLQPIDLVTVAAHEIGHQLGLGHSGVNSALMAPFYAGSHRFLDPDDVAGIQSLYPGNLPLPCDDRDNDGYGRTGLSSCRLGTEVDCNDSNVAVYPHAEELCDLIDNDCNGQADENPAYWNAACGPCIDPDGDGYGEAGTHKGNCLHPELADCNNNDPEVYPRAIEFCDGKDNNCNGQVDEELRFFNNCGRCGPEEMGIGDSCGYCGTIQCKDGGGVECDDPCECPGHPEMVRKGDYCIDKWEASVWDTPDCRGQLYGQNADWPAGFARNVFSDGLQRFPEAARDPRVCCTDQNVALYACSLSGVFPSRYISGHQARRACQNSDKRLCTEDEWKDGCDGQEGAGGCNYGTTSCDNGVDGLCNTNSVSGRGAREGGEVARTGSFSECRSPGGAYDMSGNAGELIENYGLSQAGGVPHYRNTWIASSYEDWFDPEVWRCVSSARFDDGYTPGHGDAGEFGSSGRGFRCCISL